MVAPCVPPSSVLTPLLHSLYQRYDGHVMQSSNPQIYHSDRQTRRMPSCPHSLHPHVLSPVKRASRSLHASHSSLAIPFSLRNNSRTALNPSRESIICQPILSAVSCMACTALPCRIMMLSKGGNGALLTLAAAPLLLLLLLLLRSLPPSALRGWTSWMRSE